jgi:hypothetical protein
MVFHSGHILKEFENKIMSKILRTLERVSN